jgi:ElaB/YqjD/DUF883 family membrane-anchored ribosome-binding protein
MMFPQSDSGFLGCGRNSHVDLPQSGRCACTSQLTQIKWLFCGLTYNLTRTEGEARTMFKSGELGDELLALKSEMSRLLHTPAEDMFNAARNRSEALAEEIKAALDELGETLSEEEEHVERLIAERPIAALASAFTLGIAIGFMLRRH